MIHPAEASDIPWLLDMAERFAGQSGVDEQVGFERESVEALMEHLIESPDGILLVGDRGMIGGMVIVHAFNSQMKVFQELFWRSEGREGLSLLKAAESAAKQLGAGRILMLSTENMSPERTGKLYEHLGYERGETIYTKAL